MRAVAHSAAPPDQAPYAAAEAAFAAAKAYLCSREAQQMSESDLERELHRRGQELMRKLLQGHLDQRSPGEAAGPVVGADDVERSQRRVHERHLETTFSQKPLGPPTKKSRTLSTSTTSTSKRARCAATTACCWVGFGPRSRCATTTPTSSGTRTGRSSSSASAPSSSPRGSSTTSLRDAAASRGTSGSTCWCDPWATSRSIPTTPGGANCTTCCASSRSSRRTSTRWSWVRAVRGRASSISSSVPTAIWCPAGRRRRRRCSSISRRDSGGWSASGMSSHSTKRPGSDSRTTAA